ncbi:MULTISPECIES: UDP-N-acetylmuramoyl-L-alanyl-D-glutamate--2,6-diaminopimelate ligase [Comamonas]|jgi:UDP-N-acetylmuramoyl-L-alanyl-D-glutamate--2,6-diaminopimelate ligase|uniref:UDP-N-acetylmuramoyl-L-alanyl-D-glutamate--2, 6-diaminopimelate ligase n=1 Tax=Comamonas TaxID=283 RepID=UPI0015F7F712|nr:UDP-N-acetylmuramoyl-L-alanyl-D-glutamate--2,6-diaminopimelate ligase [Comamonas koreensis]
MSATTTVTTVTSTAAAVEWLRERVRGGTLHTDSRQVHAGDAFIAWPGGVNDGRAYVAQAVQRGAAACLVEQAGLEQFDLQGMPVAAMADLKAATGPMASAWFGQPSEQLDVLAVTGTNGKTSISWWLAQAVSHLCESGVLPHRGCAMVGTLGVGIPPHQLDVTGMTTPDPVLLQRAFRSFADAGYGACAIEASSIGIAEHRLAGTRIRLAIFTNFTQDHLDYHGSMDAYWAAKEALFHWSGLQSAVVNLDDARGAALAASLAGGALDLWTVSVDNPSQARLSAQAIRAGERGLVFEVVEAGAEGAAVTLHSQVIGQYNVLNLLQVMASLRVLGASLQQAAQACAGLAAVPGRMEQVSQAGAPLVAIDYAHTPDALDKALQALRPLAVQRGGQLWCVFGCGGNRDAGKRPLMGRIAQAGADEVVVTSDNPRGEQPQAIIDDILRGMTPSAHWYVQADRAAAIDEVLLRAASQDVVLLAGKGHEDYQEVAGVKLPFLDAAQAHAALAKRKESL